MNAENLGEAGRPGPGGTRPEPPQGLGRRDGREPGRTVVGAGQLGIRLVLALVNNWPDYGGMAQYVKWLPGLPDDSYGAGVNHDDFAPLAPYRTVTARILKYVIRWPNRYTGLRYNVDPAIMTFELANESRSRSDKSGRILMAWIYDGYRIIWQTTPATRPTPRPTCSAPTPRPWAPRKRRVSLAPRPSVFCRSWPSPLV